MLQGWSAPRTCSWHALLIQPMLTHPFYHRWQAVIIDEAHRMKSTHSSTREVITSMKIKWLLLLTGACPLPAASVLHPQLRVWYLNKLQWSVALCGRHSRPRPPMWFMPLLATLPHARTGMLPQAGAAQVWHTLHEGCMGSLLIRRVPPTALPANELCALHPVSAMSLCQGCTPRPLTCTLLRTVEQAIQASPVDMCGLCSTLQQQCCTGGLGKVLTAIHHHS